MTTQNFFQITEIADCSHSTQFESKQLFTARHSGSSAVILFLTRNTTPVLHAGITCSAATPRFQCTVLRGDINSPTVTTSPNETLKNFRPHPAMMACHPPPPRALCNIPYTSFETVPPLTPTSNKNRLQPVFFSRSFIHSLSRNVGVETVKAAPYSLLSNRVSK
jgi:hypothetical protein